MKSRPLFAAKSRSFPDLLAAVAFAAILFLFAGPARPASTAHNPSLLISEVHPAAAPSGSSIESHEWVEIHNLEPHPVDLNGWTIEDSQAISPLPECSLPAGSTATVVGRSANIAVPPGKTLIALNGRRIGNGLRNAGDRVALVDPHGVRSDAASWGDVRIPRYSEPPEPGQSITRTPSGGQRLTDRPTPCETDEPVNAPPERRTHPPPDTRVRIVSARFEQAESQPESVTIRNISDEPLLTVNWRLTVGSSSVPLRSVRIEPGETYAIIESDGRIGPGLNRAAGRLVLRDANGHWLSTASWGRDETFHRLTPPASAEEVSFNPLARVHPRMPRPESFDDASRLIVGDIGVRSPLRPADIANLVTRPRAAGETKQESGQESDEAGVWISEVHPTTGQGRDEPAFEWFELTNATDAALNLSGWSIADNTAADPLGGLVIPPRSAIVVGVSTRADPAVIIAIVDGRIGNGLANAGDQLRLINPEGEVVNAISWGNDRSHTSVKSPTEDESIHRASPNSEPVLGPPSPGTPPPSPAMSSLSAEPASPAAAGDSPASSSATADSDRDATDDQAQSPAEHQAAPAQAMLRITEILPAPLPGEAEWVEIHNPTDQPIDLSGWTIGDAERRTALSGAIAPHSRFVIATQQLGVGAADLIVDRIGNGLNNDADTITLHDPSGELRFTISYGTDAVPVPGQGLSLALDPERWVVTAIASPGSEEVTPLLDDAFRSPTLRPSAPDEDRLPLTAEPPDDGLNAWMIVSFALIGVILTLIVRRWQPERESAERNAGASGAHYSGPPPEPSEPHEPERTNDNQPE